MDWNELDNKLNKKLDRKFVSCDETYELDAVISAVREVLDDQITVKVMRAVRDCCRSVSVPRPRDEFIKCLKNKLKWEMVKVLDEI
jgi:hypothetical protein